jgi:hypothetical protein
MMLYGAGEYRRSGVLPESYNCWNGFFDASLVLNRARPTHTTANYAKPGSTYKFTMESFQIKISIFPDNILLGGNVM